MVFMLLMFYWDINHLNNLSKGTQLVADKVKIWIQTLLLYLP